MSRKLAETRAEFVGRPLQRTFRIDLAFARKIYDRKEQIADLIFDQLSILRFNCRLHFADFFLHFRDHIFDFFPIEIDARNFLLCFVCSHQCRQRVRQAGEIMFFRFLFRTLNRFPLPDHRAAVAGIAFAENVRMPANELLRDLANNVVDLESASFGCDFGGRKNELAGVLGIGARKRLTGAQEDRDRPLVAGLRTRRHLGCDLHRSSASRQEQVGGLPVERVPG